MSNDTQETQIKALNCYRLGNQLFKQGQWSSALSAWRMAGQYWRATNTLTIPALKPRHWQAVWVVVLSVLCIYAVLFLVFPRHDYPMMQSAESAASQSDSRSWWERLLDNGRPSESSHFPITMREWWRKTLQDWRLNQQETGSAGGGYRPSIDQRWRDLLIRHGRWGRQHDASLNYYVTAGYSLSSHGKYQEALNVLETGLTETTRADQLADIHQAIGNVYYDQGRELLPDGLATYKFDLVRHAIESYEKSLEYQVSALQYGNLGWMAFVVEDYSLAEHYSKEALRLNDQLMYVRLNLGITYLLQGQNKKALATYREVLRHHLTDTTVLGGIKDLRELLRERNVPYGWLMLGILALRSQEYDKATDALKQFLASGYKGREWNKLASRLLQTMDWKEAL